MYSPPPRRAPPRASYFGRLGAEFREHPIRSIALAVPFCFLVYVLILIPFTPGINDLTKQKSATPSVMMSSDGVVLAAFRRVNRQWVPLGNISQNVIDALIVTEDQRFFEHHGLDYRRIVGAVLRTAKGDLQGGSTITQQLARNLFPDEIGRAATLNRKVKEAITALKIESLY